MAELELTALAGSADCALWCVDLDQPCAVEAAETLSADERARAARFVFERDRRRFVTARSALRQLLARHTGHAAAALRFDYGAFGKPALAQQQPVCEFNLSHSGALALIGLVVRRDEAGAPEAATAPQAIGVDLELLRPMPDAGTLAEAHFHADDCHALAAAANTELAFLLGWTRREACLKALGLGLAALPDLPATGLGLAPATLIFPALQGPMTLDVHSFRLASGAIASVARVRAAGPAPRISIDDTPAALRAEDFPA